MNAGEHAYTDPASGTLAGRLDEDGFLADPGDWSPEVAAALAAALGVASLETGHWRVIDTLRDHYQAHRALPPERLLCHELGLEDPCLRHLFGGRLEALQVAGLPNPGEEARTYLENEEP